MRDAVLLELPGGDTVISSTSGARRSGNCLCCWMFGVNAVKRISTSAPGAGREDAERLIAL
jgi:hypothetical protein